MAWARGSVVGTGAGGGMVVEGDRKHAQCIERMFSEALISCIDAEAHAEPCSEWGGGGQGGVTESIPNA